MSKKLDKYLLGAIVILTCTMFIWTVGTIASVQDVQTPTAISAFSA